MCQKPGHFRAFQHFPGDTAEHPFGQSAVAVNPGDDEVRTLAFGLTEQIRADIVLRAREVPIASLHLVTAQVLRHRLKPVGGHLVPDTDDRDALGTLKQREPWA